MKRPDAFGILVALMVLQGLVAAYQLTGYGSGRFGWQMYASVTQPHRFTAVYRDGSAPVDLSHYLAKMRADVNVAAAIPPAVCDRDSRAVAVQYRVIPGRTARQFQCSR